MYLGYRERGWVEIYKFASYPCIGKQLFQEFLQKRLYYEKGVSLKISQIRSRSFFFCSSCNCKQNITTSDMDHIREKLLKKGVSETAAELITSTRRKSLESNYNSSWRMWASWCDKNQIDAFRCDVIKILDYFFLIWEKLWIQDYWMP